jgi:RNA polymerase sigma-70 factor (ECF subfamily)
VAGGASLADLRRLYEERYPEYLRVATAISGSQESGRDAVHDAFVGVVRSRSSFAGQGSLAGWVWRSVVNAALKRRHDDSSAWDVPMARTIEPAARGEEPLEWLAARTAIAALPERQRLVLFLRYYADLDYESIATAIGVSLGTVGATLHRAHAALRRSLEEVAL